jgi:hypothetical protein
LAKWQDYFYREVAMSAKENWTSFLTTKKLRVPRAFAVPDFGSILFGFIT